MSPLQYNVSMTNQELHDENRANIMKLLDRGWGKAKLAHRMGVSPPAMSLWVKGARNPCPATYVQRMLAVIMEEPVDPVGKRGPDQTPRAHNGHSSGQTLSAHQRDAATVEPP